MVCPFIGFGGTRGNTVSLDGADWVRETGIWSAPGGGVTSSASENEQAESKNSRNVGTNNLQYDFMIQVSIVAMLE
jgi:hypothetical protein